MQSITHTNFKNKIKIVNGQFKDQRINLYSVVRNEIYFLPAFFDHYRKLGVQQFIILDDKSTDGSIEFLRSQPDCVLLETAFAFGQQIKVLQPDGRVIAGRAGTLIKRAIPEMLLEGRLAIYVDADEFLVLPPSLPNLDQVFQLMDANGWNALAATLVDFYPASVDELNAEIRPKTFADLINHTPFFDAVPFMEIQAGKQPVLVGRTATERLFTEFGVSALDWLPKSLVRLLPFMAPKAAWRKTPIIRWNGANWLNGSHEANHPPTSEAFLALVHFKFTTDFRRRIREAILRQSHARASQKYRDYKILLERMERASRTFLGQKSKRFESAQDLLDAGLIKIPKSQR